MDTVSYVYSYIQQSLSHVHMWRTVCDTGLRSFLNGLITSSEERRAARHTAQKNLLGLGDRYRVKR